MTDQLPTDDGMSRRNLLMGAGAAVAAGAAFAVPATVSAGAPPILAGNFHPEALNAPVGGLTYMPLDGLAFFPDTQYNGGFDPRYEDNLSGVGIAFSGGHTAGQLAAAIQVPTGSLIKQINVAYGGTPILNIFTRTLTSPTPLGQPFTQSLAAGGGAKTQSFDIPAGFAIAAGTTYSLRFYVGAGDTIHGVTIGYVPPTQSFVPFTGAVPRALDTRVSGGKLNPAEDRLVALGNVGARSAVFNLAITDTEGAGGFVGAYSAALAMWPGNASINWTGAGLNLSNGVTCAVDATGQIKIHGGANKTHVVIDMIGYLV